MNRVRVASGRAETSPQLLPSLTTEGCSLVPGDPRHGHSDPQPRRLAAGLRAGKENLFRFRKNAFGDTGRLPGGSKQRMFPQVLISKRVRHPRIRQPPRRRLLLQDIAHLLIGQVRRTAQRSRQ